MRIFFRFLLCAALLSPALAVAQRGSSATRVDLLVLGGTVVTMDATRRVIENGGIAVKDGKIVAIGTRAEIAGRYSAKQTINGTGKAVMPGLINGHTHIPMTLFRGLADDLDLQEWLTKYIFPAEAKNVTEDFVRVGTQLGLAEMIRGGTTTYCDMYYFEDAIADETSKAGVRAVLGETVIDFPVADNKTHAEAMAYTEKFVAKWKNSELITPAIAPHAAYTVSEAHLRAVRAFADRTGAPIVIHVSETAKEVQDINAQTGDSPVTYLARIGLLKNDVIAAHMVHPNADEISLLAKFGVGVVHNPQSNMKLASGVAPVPAMLNSEIAVGLGTDGAASNNDLNMWEEMDTAAKLHKLHSGDPKVISALQALEMATIGGARALHLESQIGSLETGKRADLIVVDLDGLNQTPMFNLFSHLVYATKANDVRTVVIQGRVVMLDMRLLTLNELVIKQRARAYQVKILKSLGPPRV